MKLFCCDCERRVDAVLTQGDKIYPSRPDLRYLPFWQCPACHHFVGCHYRSNSPLKPLGPIPNYEVRKLRAIIHKFIDPLWRQKIISRTQLYKLLSDELGCDAYHTGNIKTVKEGERVIKAAKAIRKRLNFDEPVSTY